MADPVEAVSNSAECPAWVALTPSLIEQWVHNQVHRCPTFTDSRWDPGQCIERLGRRTLKDVHRTAI